MNYTPKVQNVYKPFNAEATNNFEELFALDLNQPEKHVKHYKQTVPINIHHFYMVEDIKEVPFYLNMINTIRTAEQHDTIFIYLNTNGGNLHTAIQIISAIRQSSATVITCLEGMVASAGTMIFLAGHKHIVNQNCTFMIHNYSQWVGGKGNDVTIQVKYTETYFRKLADMIYGGFLSPEEITSVLEGKDIWMDSEEVAKRAAGKLITTTPPEDVGEIIKTLIKEEDIVVPTTSLPEAKPVKPKKPAKPSKAAKSLTRKIVKSI